MNAAMIDLDVVVFRPAEEADLGFVRQSWWTTFASARTRQYDALRSDALKPYADVLGSRMSPFYLVHKAYMDRVLLRPCVRVLVAAYAEDPSLIIGYCIRDDELRLIEYLCVKKPYHRHGVGAALLGASMGGEAGWRPAPLAAPLLNGRLSRWFE